MTVTEKAYAKINLHLDITGRLSGGYHSVNTVMQSVSLCDTVTLTPREDGVYSLSCNAPSVPLDENNLAVRAARAFEAAIGRQIGAEVTIDKQIPVAGGLAGGSADAAAMLRCLNTMCGSPLTAEELCAIGGKLGADIPFCVVGGSALAVGKGDLLHPFPPMPDCTLIIASGGEGVSTPFAYGLLDGLYGGFTPESGYLPRSLDGLHSAAESQSLDAICQNIFNIFESPILSVRPVAAKIKQTLLDVGAVGAMMSGSGPSVFGVFHTHDSAAVALACEKLRAIGVIPHVCKPI